MKENPFWSRSTTDAVAWEEADALVGFLEVFAEIDYVLGWEANVVRMACLFVETVVMTLYIEGVDVNADSNRATRNLHSRVLEVSDKALKRGAAKGEYPALYERHKPRECPFKDGVGVGCARPGVETNLYGFCNDHHNACASSDG